MVEFSEICEDIAFKDDDGDYNYLYEINYDEDCGDEYHVLYTADKEEFYKAVKHFKEHGSIILLSQGSTNTYCEDDVEDMCGDWIEISSIDKVSSWRDKLK